MCPRRSHPSAPYLANLAPRAGASAPAPEPRLGPASLLPQLGSKVSQSPGRGCKQDADTSAFLSQDFPGPFLLSLQGRSVSSLGGSAVLSWDTDASVSGSASVATLLPQRPRPPGGKPHPPFPQGYQALAPTPRHTHYLGSQGQSHIQVQAHRIWPGNSSLAVLTHTLTKLIILEIVQMDLQ